MRVGSGGVNAGRGGAWTLFQGTGCWADAKLTSSTKQIRTIQPRDLSKVEAPGFSPANQGESEDEFSRGEPRLKPGLSSGAFGTAKAVSFDQRRA